MTHHRLPRTAVPEHYHLHVAPDLARGGFTGSLRVELAVTEDTPQLTLNAVDLRIDDVALRIGDRVVPGESRVLPEERVALEFPETIPASSGCELTLKFSGAFHNGACGYYLAGRPPVATSFFAPVDARRAFPCWDEPNLKAKFSITLIVDEGLTAISNNLLLDETPLGDGRKQLRFATTVPLPTYVVAFIAGDLEATEPADVDGVAVRVVGPAGRLGDAAHARDAAADYLRFFTRYFEMRYPHAKLDHVAIEDFPGGSEGFGCIMYADSLLLADPAQASHVELRNAAGTIAHETAHMWFGDVVTMRWWDSVWLNEAFATLMDNTANAALHPDWEIWTTFGTGRVAAMAIDGLEHTRPVHADAAGRVEIESMLDTLTYLKGSALLFMLADYVGAEDFRRGVVKYLHEHRFGNTDAGDLWAAIESVSDVPAGRLMESWLEHGGYPILTVSASSAGVSVRQQRFDYGKPLPERVWMVPIRVRASVGGTLVERKLVLDGVSTEIDLGGVPDWVVVNAGAAGFYRCRYSPGLHSALVAAASELTAPERIALLADTWADVVRGSAASGVFLDLLQIFGDERDPDVWTTITDCVEALDRAVSDADRPRLAGRVRAVAGPAFAKIGWEPAPAENERKALTRGVLVRLLGVFGQDPEVGAEARWRFARHHARTVPLAADLAESVQQVVVAQGDADAWDAVLEVVADGGQAERRRGLHALAAARAPEQFDQLMRLSLTDAVRPGEAPLVIADVLAARDGGPVAWPRLTHDWPAVTAKVNKYLLPRTVRGVTGFTDPALGAEAREWLGTNGAAIGAKRIGQFVEQMDLNIAFSQRVRAEGLD